MSNEAGYLPPQAPELEDLILGSLMLEKDAFERSAEILKAEVFYKPNNQIIYRAIATLVSRNEPADIVTVTQELKKTGHLELIGGPYHLVSLTNRVASSANLEFHSRILAQKYIQREVARISSVFNAKSYESNTDVFDLIDEYEFQMTALKSGFFIGTKTKTTREHVEAALTAISNAKTNGGVLGPKTGLTELDDLLRGLRKGKTYVIAARAAMGKSAFMLCVAKSLVMDQNVKTAIFSLEMEGPDLIHRLLSDMSDIDNNKLASGKLTASEELMLDTVQKKIDERLHIDDTPAITIQYLESKVRKLSQQGFEYIIIDYLQLMELNDKDRKGKSREQEIAYITKNLKRLAKKYKIGVIELSQVARSCEDREPPRPMLSDLRESGAIEQDADVVIFIYRPEYYNIEFIDGKPTRGKAELIIAKHRGGPIDCVYVRYKGEYTRFEDLEKEETVDSITQTQTPLF